MNIIEVKKNINNNLNEEEILFKTNRLNKIKMRIENMDKGNHISALYMITKNKSVKYSENINGTFINLSDLDNNMLFKIEDFIEYIEIQKYEIEDIEKKREQIENIYFKQNKE
tara:strand:+ start:1169 stop:1507 length:339 start_codon:yes stop_codon:yes gene_type:complete